MRPEESFVGQPVRSLQTMLRLLSYEDPRLPTVVPDGIYGPGTVQAVNAFQRTHVLPETGVADQETWDAIADAYSAARADQQSSIPLEIQLDPGGCINPGDCHPYVYLLQTILLLLSMDCPNIDAPKHTGVMDECTVQALKQFQKLCGIEETGVADKAAVRHLAAHFALHNHRHAAQERENTDL